MTEEELLQEWIRLNQRISKLEAKSIVNEMLIQIVFSQERIGLIKRLPELEQIAEGYCNLIKSEPIYKDVHEEFQERFRALYETLRNKHKSNEQE